MLPPEVVAQLTRLAALAAELDGAVRDVAGAVSAKAPPQGEPALPLRSAQLHVALAEGVLAAYGLLLRSGFRAEGEGGGGQQQAPASLRVERRACCAVRVENAVGTPCSHAAMRPLKPPHDESLHDLF
jgi:hypothetical protein